MFTGIVEERARVRSVRRNGEGATFVIETRMQALVLGESIAVDGVCLTVAEIPGGAFVAQASLETLAKSTLHRTSDGAEVHLERALRLGDRLGGHLVTGHVDGLGTVASKEPLGDALVVTYQAPEVLAPFIAPKGSITVDGVSLTVNSVEGPRFTVALVPYTRRATHLDAREVGAAVNLEVDVIAKYVARLMGKSPEAPAPGGITLDLLARQGYL